MILWWRSPSGQTADARCAALSLAARGLLWTLCDFADGTGLVPTGNLSLDVVLRGAAPHDAPAAREMAWRDLADAGLVSLDAEAILLHLPRRESTAPAQEASEQGTETVPSDDETRAPSAPRNARKLLDAWASRYGLRTPAERTAWSQGEGAPRVALFDPAVVASWVEAAGRRGGRFGHERGSHTRPTTGANTPSATGANTVPTLAPERSQHGANVGTADGANTGANAPSPSHSPSGEKESGREGESAREGAQGSGANTGANTTPAISANSQRDLQEQIEDVLTRSSQGRIDLLSAPASVRVALRGFLTEMKVDLELAQVMGELGASPATVWPYLRDPSRVTANFLVGKTDNAGQRSAGPLVELVAKARTVLAERAPAAPARTALAPQTRRPISDAEAAEALRLMRERPRRPVTVVSIPAASSPATDPQEPNHVP